MTGGKKKTLEKLQLEMKDTLESLGCSLEVRTASSRNGDIRFMCRILDEPKWMKVISEFLRPKNDWYTFIGKKFFYTEDGRFVFGWVLIFESDEIEKAVQDIRKLFIRSASIVQAPSAEQADNIERGMIEVPLPSPAGFQERLQKRVSPIR